jgi:hypothetical protein
MMSSSRSNIAVHLYVSFKFLCYMLRRNLRPLKVPPVELIGSLMLILDNNNIMHDHTSNYHL